jgi:hypothetical protein
LRGPALALVEQLKSRPVHARNMPDKPAKENDFQLINRKKKNFKQNLTPACLS